MRHILAALDLTPQPGRAFDRAVQLALQHGSELTLAHIVAAGGAAPDDEAETSSADSALARADRKLREYPIPAALKVNFRVAVGNPAREIAALAHEAGAELVVLGAHREDPIPDLFFDTTAYYTMEHCDAPILIVRDETRGPYRRVLAPTDFSACAKRALRAAVTLAPQAEFHALHVYETPFLHFIRFNEEEAQEYQQERYSRIERDVQEEMRDFLANHPGRSFPEIQTLLVRDDIDAGIENTAKQLEPDLLAMGLSGRGLAALVGGRTKAYLKAPFCDLLVTP
jgi:nucleotide-binding universal stress UspA family protein